MTINELQQWVAKDWAENSHTIPTREMQLLYIMEELGEVAEAIRKTSGSKERVDKDVDVGGEFADLIISIVTLANTYNIDVTKEVEKFQGKLKDRHKNGF